MTEPLSPTAQAVFAPFTEGESGAYLLCDPERLAAAIRTLVKKTLPEESTTPMLKEGYEESVTRWSERQRIRAAQLAVADELEGRS